MREHAEHLRQMLEQCWGPETAFPGSQPSPVSSGQCAVTALLVAQVVGCFVVSTQVNGVSHWFNQVYDPETMTYVDLDLTGDQFGLDPVQLAPADSLYGDTRQRFWHEVNDETRQRYNLLLAKFIAASSQPSLDTYVGTSA